MEFEIIETTKGKPCALHDGYRYRMIRKKPCGAVTWLCVKERGAKCKGRLVTKQKSETEHDVINIQEHSCKADVTSSEVFKAVINAKKRVREDTEFVPTSTNYNDHLNPLLNKGMNLADVPSYNTLKRSLNRIRRKAHEARLSTLIGLGSEPTCSNMSVSMEQRSTTEMSSSLSDTLNLFETFKSQDEEKDSDEESFHLPLDGDDEMDNSGKDKKSNPKEDENEDEILNKFENVSSNTAEIDAHLEESLLNDQEEPNVAKKINENSLEIKINKDGKCMAVKEEVDDESCPVTQESNIHTISEIKKENIEEEKEEKLMLQENKSMDEDNEEFAHKEKRIKHEHIEENDQLSFEENGLIDYEKNDLQPESMDVDINYDNGSLNSATNNQEVEDNVAGQDNIVNNDLTKATEVVSTNEMATAEEEKIMETDDSINNTDEEMCFENDHTFKILDSTNENEKNNEFILDEVMENENKLVEIEKEFKDNEKKLEDKEKELEDNEKELEGNPKELEDGEKQVDVNEQPIEENEQSIEDNEQPIEKNEQPIEDEQPIENNKQPTEDNQQTTEVNKEPIEENEKPIEENEQHLEENKLQLEKNELQSEKNEHQIENSEQPIDETEQTLDENKQTIGENKQTIEENEQPTKETEELIGECEQPISEDEQHIQENAPQLKDNEQQLEENEKQLGENEKQVDNEEIQETEPENAEIEKELDMEIGIEKKNNCQNADTISEEIQELLDVNITTSHQNSDNSIEENSAIDCPQESLVEKEVTPTDSTISEKEVLDNESVLNDSSKLIESVENKTSQITNGTTSETESEINKETVLETNEPEFPEPSKSPNFDSEDLLDISIIRDTEEDDAHLAQCLSTDKEENQDDTSNEKTEENDYLDMVEKDADHMDVDDEDICLIGGSDKDEMSRDSDKIEAPAETITELEENRDEEMESADVEKTLVSETDKICEQLPETTAISELESTDLPTADKEDTEPTIDGIQEKTDDSQTNQSKEPSITDQEPSKTPKRFLSDSDNDEVINKKLKLDEKVEKQSKEETPVVPVVKKPTKLNSLLNFADFMKKNHFKKLTRAHLEEFCFQKICEGFVYKSEVADLNHQIRLQDQTLENFRKDQQQLTKQVRDLEIVNRKLMAELRQNYGTKKPLVPLKITRSVGLQVKLATVDVGVKRRVVPAPTNTPQRVQPQQQTPTNNRNQRPVQNGVVRQVTPSPQKAANNTPILSTVLQNRRVQNVVKSPNTPNRVLTTPPQKKGNASVIDLTDEEDKKGEAMKKTVVANAIRPVATIAQGVRLTNPTQIKTTPISGVVTSTTPQLMYVIQPGTQLSQGVLTSSAGGTQKAVIVNFQSNNILTNALNGSSVTMLPKPTNNTVQAKSVLRTNVVTSTVKHPAPLPGIPFVRVAGDKILKPIPPKPHLTIRKTDTGIILQWKMPYDLDLYETIASYQLYAYQETTSPPSTDMWRRVGDVKALALPMACTLTQFADKNKYYFAVRPVDTYKRIGAFSDPEEISL